ncbi:MAG: hypothetical protein EAY66_01770 [Sphingobacteriales bacterium]|nr:MAG: hypothetical protein EAY66_01770 [Sphingobacteriales bacterium]
MKDTHTILMFLKFGQEKDIKDLYNNGTIYMNPIQLFRTVEDGELRGDSYEGVSRIKNYPPGKFEIPSIGYKGNYLSLHIRQSYKEVLGNIFSLYCISSHGWENPNDFKMDERIKQFGSHCLMIKDNKSFMERMENSLQNLKMKYLHGFVKYYDKESISREITVFEKPIEFEYQNEFRFYLNRFSTDPISFNIGSLADISEIFTAESIIDELKLQPK